MSNEQKKYFRLTKAERVAIEQGLDGGHSARFIATALGRSPATITGEIHRNRTVCKGPGKGGPVDELPKDCCAKLCSWPGVCNGCKYRRYHCTRPWRCEYCASRAQMRADEVLASSRRGVDRDQMEFESMMGAIRADVGRGLSPTQIVAARTDEFKVAPSTVYRWIAKGYGGMASVDLRRKVGYKPRRRRSGGKPSAHGSTRSYAAFCRLPQERCASACEMDTVIGCGHDTQCVLTLYVRPCKFQLALLLSEKSSSAVASALDMLEKTVGKKAFQQLFNPILTDNGTEFANCAAIERSVFGGTRRCEVYYCDVRASQQKGGCERNHVELRKLIPKRGGISFDRLNERDMAVAMSQLNSEPRPSLANMSPIALLKAAYAHTVEPLLDGLGIEEIAYKDLVLGIEAINEARKGRGEGPLT